MAMYSACNSVGQSAGLMSRTSGVQAPVRRRFLNIFQPPTLAADVVCPGGQAPGILLACGE